MKHRPDIDGLRSLAVMPVIMCHAGVPYFPGGFVGVDIFFVVSGFLITSIIREEVSRDSFTVTGFYERRCRRILPALFVVSAACMIAGYFIMLPRQYSELAKSVVAALLSASNVFFWGHTGYFAPVADWMPMLHTWSLGVEEQYYIVFPIFMILARRWRTSMQVATIGLVFFASFALSAYGAFNKPSATFYLTPFRAWELLLGVLIAYVPAPLSLSRWVRELAALVGLLMLLVPVAVYNDTTPFPGLAAAAPCLATAILLMVGGAGPNLVKSALENRFLVFVGLISYSLYLLHWPVLVFMRLRLAQTELEADTAALGVILTFLLAIVVWYFVEQPFRNKRWLGRPAILRLSAGSIAAGVVASSAVSCADGLPGRVAPKALALERASEDVDLLARSCIAEIGDPACEFGAQDSTPVTFALWGDSHAAMLRPAIEEAMRETGRRGTLLWRPGCEPTLGLEKLNDPDAKECRAFRERALSLLTKPENGVRTVFLSGRWLPLATGRSASVGGSFVQLVRDSDSMELGMEENRRVFSRSLRRTVEALRAYDIEVVLLGGAPDIGWDVPTVLALSAMHDVQVPRLASWHETKEAHAFADAVFWFAAQHDGVRFVPVWPLLCENACPISVQERAVYSDDDHLSFYAAKELLGPKLRRSLETAAIATLREQ